jgi:hypothetical protein
MMLGSILLVIALAGGQTGGEAVALAHTYRAGDVQRFVMTNVVMGEEHAGDLVSWLPFRVTITMDYSIKVLGLGPAGTADVRYENVGTVYHFSQQLDKEPYDDKREEEWAVMALSPTNQILHVYDMSKPPKDGKGKDEEEKRASPGAFALQGPEIDSGDLSTALIRLMQMYDLFKFGPLLPGPPVKPGDTWRSTADVVDLGSRFWSLGQGRGASRVDMTYSYEGVKAWEGKDTWVIRGTYKTDLDIRANMLAQLPREYWGLVPIKAATLKVEGEVQYYLDPATGDVRRIEGTSEGNVKVDADDRFASLRHEMRAKSQVTLVPAKE